MHRFLIAIVVLFNTLLTSSAHAADAPAAPVVPITPPLKIAIEGDKVLINGTAFAMPCQRADLEAVLGKPDRESDLTNFILTWDQLGLVAYVIKEPGPKGKDGKATSIPTPKVRQVTVALDKVDLKYWPAKLFPGVVTVDGAPVTAKTDVTELNAAKKGEPFKAHSAIPAWHIINHENALIVIENASEKVGSKDAKISRVTIDARLAKPAKK